MTPETFTCSICGTEHPLHDRVTFDGKDLCPRCLEEETAICSRCGDRFWRDDDRGNDDMPVCLLCYDQYYTSCDHCSRTILRTEAYYANDDDDGDYPYCRECFFRHGSHRDIRDYYYKPDPVFYGVGKRWFGLELEVDGAGEDNHNARQVLDIANTSVEERVYCKHDGSLNDGFELVSHPMTLEYHLKEMPWDDVLTKLRGMGYLSHRANTCGLHIHVNRTAFGETEAAQDACIARILYFFEKHWEEMLKFSRRTHRQLERWANRYGYKEQPMDILDHAKKGYGVGRYTCVNLMNSDTIEFRMFRGTLKLNTFIATLQLVNRVCDVALFLSDEELKNMSWTTFVSGCQEPELMQYLKERRLYVNEPVAAEEEV